MCNVASVSSDHNDMSQMNVAFAGLTAAGKTTHCHLLAARLGYSVVEAAPILLELLGMSDAAGPRFWFDHLEETERRREGDSIDDRLEAILLSLVATREATVFDTWALPWLSDQPMILIWIESDYQSRAMKCFVSQGESPSATLASCGELVIRKDSETRERLSRRHSFDLYRDHSSFDAVLNNSVLITEPTRSSADRGIAMFEPYVYATVGWLRNGNLRPLQQLAHREPDTYGQVVAHVRGLPPVLNA